MSPSGDYLQFGKKRKGSFVDARMTHWRAMSVFSRTTVNYGCEIMDNRQWHLLSPFLLTFRLTRMKNQFFVFKAFLA
jgi:hypothetical protein